MYSMALDGKMHPQTNAALREYARLEYRSQDVHWLLATVDAAPRPRPARRRLRLFARRAPPAPRPVACKGSPRGGASQERSPG